ncbi:MAG: hypothetical protein L0Z49_14105 [Actinobacteria bacterium]|nr:hypothetical protein [Actinomycetota bacterium]MCI0677841.1 hypothetical protein [Actinomycetota bacterium]
MLSEKARKALDIVARAALGVVGLQVGLFWVMWGLLPMVDIWSPSLFDLGRVLWLPTLGGLVLLCWSILGIIKPTPLRVIPPLLVSTPVAVIALIEIVRYSLLA